jgi:DNA-binding Lrp family transcriptional regulator
MTMAYVFLNTESGEDKKVLEGLKKIDEIKEFYDTRGVYDKVVKVEARDRDALKNVITYKLRQIPGVQSTLTTIVKE